MSLDDDTCDHCGGYIDSMNSDCISRYVNKVWRLWCDIDCVQAWVKDYLEKKES